MVIGIDARLMNETGVGRYIRNLIAELAQIDKDNRYVVFLRDDSWQPPNERWERRIADIPWHSIAEQINLPRLYSKEHLDLLHVPYFTIPIFYPGKFIVTMHDLTILHYPTGEATTLPTIVYWIKLLGYWALLFIGLHRANHIIAVSNATKNELVDHFALDEQKIFVVYEGVGKEFSIDHSVLKTKKRMIQGTYFLYVGNAYPHKNLEILLEAMRNVDSKLVLVGKPDIFYDRLKKSVKSDQVIFFGHADDVKLRMLYMYATALVFPSIMEGFGLPALEAVALGTPVICSDIPAFREILGPLGNYFNPSEVSSLHALLSHPENLKNPTKEDQLHLLMRFTWRQMAEKTLQMYERAWKS